ncbi:hypothetical protein BJ165DRAFT_1400632 [Panaeolus papilionaceus]|nr:hypothetical protein BJ165DRAFT_1400632 [Panaeolus papilionaceus]
MNIEPTAAGRENHDRGLGCPQIAAIGSNSQVPNLKTNPETNQKSYSWRFDSHILASEYCQGVKSKMLASLFKQLQAASNNNGSFTPQMCHKNGLGDDGYTCRGAVQSSMAGAYDYSPVFYTIKIGTGSSWKLTSHRDASVIEVVLHLEQYEEVGDEWCFDLDLQTMGLANIGKWDNEHRKTCMTIDCADYLRCIRHNGMPYDTNTEESEACNCDELRRDSESYRASGDHGGKKSEEKYYAIALSEFGGRL